MNVIDNWKEFPDGRIIHITNPDVITVNGKMIRLRQNETGIIYMNAHDTQNSPFTYTEVQATPDPDQALEWPIGRPAEGYAKGALVKHGGVKYVSEVDNNIWAPCNTAWNGTNTVYGWTECEPPYYDIYDDPDWEDYVAAEEMEE